jgi:GalNAc-alpha-(1->4)-GalNAc-alpha-(1->3)-diNAcBac-PP-undecaprenol alpha-1,4-N-acetyl-D-galactosaminyltransferase
VASALEGDQKLERPLRVVCVIASMQAGGAARVMAQLCNHFAARRHDTTLVTLGPSSEEPFYDLSEAVCLSPLGRLTEGAHLGRVARVIAWIAALRRTFVAVRPDVVISFVDLTNVMVLLAALGLRLPVIVAERSDPAAHSRRLSRLDRSLRRLTYPRANRIVVQTDRAATSFSRYPPSQIVKIPNPVSPASLFARPAEPSPDRRYRIIGVGRLDRQKGFDILVESFAGLAARFPDWDVAIFGQGADRAALLAQIERHGLGGRIKLMDVTRDIAGELARSHIMAFPSRYEGFPNALAEAMAAGLPAVAMENVSGVEDLIVPGQTGILAGWNENEPRGPVPSLSDGLARLMASAELRTSIGAAACIHVQRFLPSMVFDQWDELVAAVLRKNLVR